MVNYAGSTGMFRTNNPINLGTANNRGYKQSNKPNRLFMGGNSTGFNKLIINPKTYKSGGIKGL